MTWRTWTSKEQARKFRYRDWAGNPGGYAYNEAWCAAEVHDGGRSVLFHQCRYSPGHGPDGMFCKVHAAQAERARAR